MAKYLLAEHISVKTRSIMEGGFVSWLPLDMRENLEEERGEHRHLKFPAQGLRMALKSFYGFSEKQNQTCLHGQGYAFWKPDPKSSPANTQITTWIECPSFLGLLG